jgi:hypothetical protein
MSWQAPPFDIATNTITFMITDGNPSGFICSIMLIRIGSGGWNQIYHASCNGSFSVPAAPGTYDLSISTQDRSIGGTIHIVG